MVRQLRILAAAVVSVVWAIAGRSEELVVRTGDSIFLSGDSITACGGLYGVQKLLPSALKELGVEVDVQVQAYGGRVSSQVAKELQKGLGKKPKFVLLEFGINDLNGVRGAVTWEDFAANLEAIWTMVEQAGAIPVQVGLVREKPGEDRGWCEKTKALCASRSRPVIYADVFAEMNAAWNDKSEAFQPNRPFTKLTVDGIHPNLRGYKAMTWAILRALGAKETDRAKVYWRWYEDFRFDAMTSKPIRKGHADFGRSERVVEAEPGTDSVRVALTLGEPLRCGVNVTLSGRPEKAASLGLNPWSQTDEYQYVAYAARGNLARQGKLPRTDWHADTQLEFAANESGWFGFRYYLYPYFDQSYGIYDHKLVTELMPTWRKIYERADKRVLNFRFEYNPDLGRTEAYLDNQYCGLVPGTGHVVKVSSYLATNGTMTCSWFKAAKRPEAYALPPLPHRASPSLGADARLEFDGPAPLAAWKPEESIDSGRHYRTTYAGSFGWNPYFGRTPFQEGTEYHHWSIPAGHWLYVNVLCADLPEKDKVPVLGTRLTILGYVNRDSMAETFTDLSTAATNPNVRVVGRLVRGKGGSVPLYLVRQQIDIRNMLAVWNDKAIWSPDRNGNLTHLPRSLGFPHFDFEFIGAGSDSRKLVGWGQPRSSVQVFGATVEQAPFGFDVSESQRGNIFENDERPETGWEVTAFADGTSGSIAYEIYDDAFRPIRRGEERFALARAGETRRISIDLAMKDVGWYGIDFHVRDAAGVELAFHRASFALLGRNDREAGFESPYACWPQGTGYERSRDGKWGFPQLGRSNSNPDRHEVAKQMHKAGYHSAWSVPVSNEQEHAEWQLTLSAHSKYCNPPQVPHADNLTPEDIAVITNRIEEAVAFYKEEHARYPHCKTIQVLHECGGRELCRELHDDIPAVHGKYLAEKGAPGTFYITEYCKRMKKEFPDCRIMIGNGSSASEMIAHLCRDEGLDLSLADELGIESKGFGSMPEIPDNLESPGMLYALRETARIFGYSNHTMNACNECVFRTERIVDETWSKAQRMEVTDFSLRDYLLFLAWGCRTISTGHLEDCFGPYYESNWGAGGQCKFYPYSYPKRLFVGLANFTKVFDKATFSRRIPTGEVSTYALEFRRDRRVKDYASAFWTPQHGAEIQLEFAPGTNFRQIDWQGRTIRSSTSNFNSIVIGSTPTYVISDRPVAKVTVLRHFQDDLGTDRVSVLAMCGEGGAEGKTEFRGAPWHITRGDYGGVVAVPGSWAFAEIDDPSAGKALEARLKTRMTANFPRPEYGRIDIRDAKEVPAGYRGRIGLMVRGNGSFGRVVLELRDARNRAVYLRLGYRGHACFNGWAMMTADLKGTDVAKFADTTFRPTGIWFSTTAKALDPVALVDNPLPLAFKDVCLLPPEDVSKTVALDAARSAESLKYVPAKDL